MQIDFYGDQFKWFIGVVKSNCDDKNRVRVRIFGIHKTDDITNVSDGDLPQALVLYPTTGGQASGGSLSHGLKPGTWVMGFFADGDDCQQPVIVGVMDGGIGSSNNRDSLGGSISPGSAGDASINTTAGAQANTLSTSGAAGNSFEGASIPGKGNLEKAYNMLYELIEKSGQSGGVVHAQVSGILGNIMAESKCDPSANNDDDRGKRSFGICQWRGDRLTNLERLYGTNSTLDQQISFLWLELNSASERNAFTKIMAARDLTDATIGMVFFERPECYRKTYVDTNNPRVTLSDGKSYRNSWFDRIKFAQQIYSTIKYTPRDSGRR